MTDNIFNPAGTATTFGRLCTSLLTEHAKADVRDQRNILWKLVATVMFINHKSVRDSLIKYVAPIPLINSLNASSACHLQTALLALAYAIYFKIRPLFQICNWHAVAIMIHIGPFVSTVGCIYYPGSLLITRYNFIPAWVKITSIINCDMKLHVWEWISNFILHITWHVTTFPIWDFNWCYQRPHEITARDKFPFTRNKVTTWGPFYYHELTLMSAWISNYIYCKVCDEITYPFPNSHCWSLGMD